MSSLDGALVVVLAVLVLLLVCSASGMLVGSVVRAHRARSPHRVRSARRVRSPQATGLLRAGSPAGEDDPARAAFRAGGIAGWTRMSGGSG